MRRVIFNQKGGVGKTTVTCNLAAINASRGRNTLVIDLDPQANSTHYLLGVDPTALPQTVAGFFHDVLARHVQRRGLSTFIRRTPFAGLDVLPAHPDLDWLQDKLAARHKIYKLRDAIGALEHYEDVFFDTPPAVNFFTMSALIAADRCLIPFDCDDFSRRAIYRLLDHVEEIQEDHNPYLVVEGILVNEFQSSALLPQRLVQDLERDGLPVLRSRLSASVKIRESHDRSCPMVHLAPQHKLTQELATLLVELEAHPGAELQPRHLANDRLRRSHCNP